MQQRTALLDDARYLNAVADMAQRLDRILSGVETVTLRMVPNPPMPNVPAYQSGANLYIVPSVVKRMVTDPNDEREVLPLLLALNLHEYGHFDFTPKPDNAIWQREKSRVGAGHWQGIFRTLNCLEDQRQELLVSTRFPRARNYFRLATLRGMLMLQRERGSIPPENFLLYYGRRHILPRPLLARLEAALIAKASAPTVAHARDLIDEFIRLPSTTDAALARQWAIAEELHGTFGGNMADRDCLTVSTIGARTSKAEQVKTSKQAGELLDKLDKEQAKREEAKAEQAKAEAEKNPEPPSDEEPGETTSSAPGEPSSDAADEAVSPTNDSTKSDKAETKADEAETKTADPGDTSPTEIAAEDEEAEDEATDETDAAGDTGDEDEDEETDEDEDELEDLEADADGDGDEDGEDETDSASGTGDKAGDEMADALRDYIDRAEQLGAGDIDGQAANVRAVIYGTAAQRLAAIFKQVSTDLGPVIHYRQRSGSVDLRRVPANIANPRDRAVFRRLQPDLKSEAGMLVHILLDSSSSMKLNRQTAVDATATIARACDLAGHRAKVTTFASAHQSAILKEWTDADLPLNGRWFNGGTQPAPVLRTLAEDFRKASLAYKLQNRIVLIITDGQFEDGQESAEILLDLKRKGTHVFLIGIGTDPSGYAGYETAEDGTRNWTTRDYQVDGKLKIENVAELESAMRVMLKQLAVRIAQTATAAYA